MTTWHGYILIKDIPNGWDNNLLDSALGGIGKQDGSNPAQINHRRMSLDGSAIIVEALFQQGEITRDALIDTVAAALGLTHGQVDASLNLTLCGGSVSTWAESHAAVMEYLAANRAQWEPELA